MTCPQKFLIHIWLIFYFFNPSLPRNIATSPSSSSMFSNLLYFATLSVLQGAPVFICPAFVATATSAIVVSSVSPLLCDTIAVYPFFLASSIASNVSVSVPIWFNLINILFATAAIFYTLKDPLVGEIIFIILFILVVWFVLHTTIISDKTPQKTEELINKIKKKKKEL